MQLNNGRFHHRRKTRRGRLSQLDDLLIAWQPELFAADAFDRAPLVDMGLGARPWTTVELADRVDPIAVIGVDLSHDLVARAQEHARPGLTFVYGDLAVPEPCRLVRVMNVLRDLEAHEVPAAHEKLAVNVLPGGWVVEGSCGPTGEAGTAHALQKRNGVLHRTAMVFWLDGSRGTAPIAFRDRLPRDLAGDRPHPVQEVLEHWMQVYRALGPIDDRLAVAAQQVPDVAAVGPGFVWTPAGGVPPRVS